MSEHTTTATKRCPRCDGAGREPLPLPDGPSTIPCPGADADPPGCDGTGVVPAPDRVSRLRHLSSRDRNQEEHQ